MTHTRSIEFKVGLFVVVCLVIIAGLIIKFGKLERFSSDVYTINVVFPNAAGIVRDASVVYAGLPVGKVKQIQLAEGGTYKVRLTLAIYKGYMIRQDAKFVINQSGLLGDRFVDVVPESTTAPPLEAGSEVKGTSSVDLADAIRSVVEVLQEAGGTIGRIDEMVRRTDAAIKRIDELVLTTQSLDHVSSTLAHIDATTSNTAAFTAQMGNVLGDTRQGLSNTLDHFSLAADDVQDAALRVKRIVQNNETEISLTASNLAQSTARLNAILEGVQRGEGTAGKLLTDPTLHDEIVKLVYNWRKYDILYKDKNAKPETDEERRGKAPNSTGPVENFRPNP